MQAPSIPDNGIAATAGDWLAHPFVSPEPAGGWLVAALLFLVLLLGWRQAVHMMAE